MMDLERFELGLDRFGGALDRWPADERSAAEALLARSEAARALLAEMVALEALIPLQVTAVANAGRMPERFMPERAIPEHSMAERAMAAPQVRRLAPAVRRAGWAAALAAALVLGLLVGHGNVDSPGDAADHILTAASDPLGQVDVD